MTDAPAPFGEVGPRDWDRRPVYLLGGGPSLLPHLHRLSELALRGHVLAINDAWRAGPCEIIFTVDHVWLEKNLPRVARLPAPVVAAVELDHPRPRARNLTYVVRQHRSAPDELSDDPRYVSNLQNSGASGVSYAVLRGAREIYLLGLDFAPGADGRTHWHEGYAWHAPSTTQRVYPRWAAALTALRPALDRRGVRVVNCSPTGLLPEFPTLPYEALLS